MSLVTHRQPRFSGSSASATTTTPTFPHFSPENNSVLRPPLLSIPQLQSTTNSTTTITTTTTASEPQSPPTSTSDYSPPKLNKPLSPPRGKRRKLRSHNHLSTQLSSNPSGLRSKNKHLLFRQARAHQQQSDHPSSDLDDQGHHQHLLPLQRLKLQSSIPPLLPPTIPQDFMVPPSQCSYAHNTPIVQPSYTTPRKTPLDTYTCIRTKLNPFSVSISSQPAVRFSKSIPRLTRLQRSGLSSSQDSTPSSSLELKKSEEQDKWWHWARLCKVTGDGNKSSHLAPLRCRDLKRNSDQSHTDIHQDQELRIHTRPLCESALEQQKFHYSG
ncbi:hypothetical protein VP01_1781g4 [Puccinia sorghi]|uniref:Uncharacterized protein n=1 Tax=Puccinia sorghi TaxID=27349 RepID=A0A0L6VGG9_9BASI|nr:hypothetical protein VP01_1781g4 [Puccinia sorghi]